MLPPENDELERGNRDRERATHDKEECPVPVRLEKRECRGDLRAQLWVMHVVHACGQLSAASHSSKMWAVYAAGVDTRFVTAQSKPRDGLVRRQLGTNQH